MWHASPKGIVESPSLKYRNDLVMEKVKNFFLWEEGMEERSLFWQ
jgi:hypothetical protein